MYRCERVLPPRRAGLCPLLRHHVVTTARCARPGAVAACRCRTAVSAAVVLVLVLLLVLKVEEVAVSAVVVVALVEVAAVLRAPATSATVC